MTATQFFIGLYLRIYITIDQSLYMISKKQITNLVVVQDNHVCGSKKLELPQLGSLHSSLQTDLHFDSNNHIHHKQSIFHLADYMDTNNRRLLVPTVQNKSLKISCWIMEILFHEKII